MYAAGVDFVEMSEAAAQVIATFLEGVKADRRT
jgi:hypothetical protein